MTTPHLAPKDRLIVALDLPDVAAARAMVATLGNAVSFYKIGLELAYGGGLSLAQDLRAEGKQVFLDLKFHDIPNTVARATAQVANLGATFLTIHAFPQTMQAALQGAAGSSLQLLGVTVMTSYTDEDVAAAGYRMGAAELVAHRASQARDLGLAGLILSPEEARDVRKLVGPSLQLITPGIRPTGAALGDQKRVMTPGLALKAGADRMVVGRPITQAHDPRAAALAILAEIAAAEQS